MPSAFGLQATFPDPLSIYDRRFQVLQGALGAFVENLAQPFNVQSPG